MILSPILLVLHAILARVSCVVILRLQSFLLNRITQNLFSWGWNFCCSWPWKTCLVALSLASDVQLQSIQPTDSRTRRAHLRCRCPWVCVQMSLQMQRLGADLSCTCPALRTACPTLLWCSKKTRKWNGIHHFTDNSLSLILRKFWCSNLSECFSPLWLNFQSIVKWKDSSCMVHEFSFKNFLSQSTKSSTGNQDFVWTYNLVLIFANFNTPVQDSGWTCTAG